jgi:hypothetical protein
LCCDSLYFIVSLVFVAIFLFLLIIIHLVPYKWYEISFPLHKLWAIFFSRVETCTVDVFKAQRYFIQQVKLGMGKIICKKYKQFHMVTRNEIFTLLETSVTPIGTPLSSTASYKIRK